MEIPIWKGVKLEGHTQPVFAFASGGVNYFQIADSHNMFYERAWMAKDIYQELENKIDNEYLTAMLEGLEVAVNNGKLTDIAVIVYNAKQRRQYVSHIDTLYKLASVLYFDEQESPMSYDLEYNLSDGGKVDRWKRNKDVESFFLACRLESFLPSLNTMRVDLQTYTRGQRLDESHQLNYLIQILSRHNETKDMATSLLARVETLKELTK